MFENIKNGIKKVTEGFKKTIKAIGKAIKFFASTVGFIVGIAILIIFCIIVLAVIVKSMEKALAKFLDAEYAGISTEGDYETIVSSIGYAGYDSLISEKIWQEYMAYEYAVLVDVAEYLYDGQTEFNPGGTPTGSYKDIYATSGDQGYITKLIQSGASIETIKSPTYMPYLEVKAEYDVRLIDDDDWKKAVEEGQNSARFGPSASALGSLSGTEHIEMGGNRDVMMPIIMYEFAGNPNDENAGSLIPYIIITKEGLKYRYYTINGTAGIGVYDARNFYKTNKDSNSGGADIGYDSRFGTDIKGHIMEVNSELNKNNSWLPNSLTAAQSLNVGAGNVAGSNRIDADQAFDPSLYHTDDVSAIAYKIPLQLLIDRYLPKASLLTAWYLLKESDLSMTPQGEKIEATEEREIFQVYDLMEDIKDIYNHYSLTESELMETMATESVEVIEYDEDGNVKRDENGVAIRAGTEERAYATTNICSFVKFGQVGLETNRFSVWEYYDVNKVGSGPKCDVAGVTRASNIVGGDYEATVPVVADLISKSGETLDKMDVEVTYEYKYEYEYIDVNEVEKSISISINDEDLDYINRTIGSYLIKSSKVKADKYKFNNQTLRSLYNNPPEGGARVSRVKLNSDRTKYNIYYKIKTEILVSAEDFDEATYTVPYTPDQVTSSVNETDITNPQEIADFIYAQIIQAESDIVDQNPQYGKSYAQESKERWLVNHDYIYGLDVQINNGVISTTILYDVDNYQQKFAIYNFSIGDITGESVDQIRDKLKKCIDEAVNELVNNADFCDKIKAEIKDDPNNPSPKPTKHAGKKAYKFKGLKEVTKIIKVDVIDNSYEFGKLYNTSSPKAAYIIDEQTVDLTLNVPQKRMSALLVTDVETWAKSAEYEIDIVQNSFNSSNYRFVIPHSWCNFGLRVFNINEKATYRTGYYMKYFSKLEDKNGKLISEPAIKEEDVLAMLMKWEEYGKAGNDTAYVFMRDLYKLVMYIKDDGGVLESAYNYLYVPEYIWDFREGITQEAFWTEHLASELYGADALSAEEQKKLRVKKNEIAWQNVDYDSYEECENDDKQAIYALFPHGNEFVRSWFMENAVATGKFYDGGYKEGHGGSDWSARSITSNILKKSTDESGDNTYAKVYDYEVERRKMVEFLKTGVADEAKVTAELNKELKEYTVRSPLVAVAPGLVTKASYNCYGGFSVHIQHNNNGEIFSGDFDYEGEGDTTPSKTTYAHMRRWPEVQVGDIVGPGTIIGYEGTTGNSGGPHLHMGINVNGNRRCPAEYMGPIFTPFYNSEKANEVIMNVNGDIEEALGSEYFSLIRTVLFARFEDGKLVGTDGLEIGGDMLSFSNEELVERHESGDEVYIRIFGNSAKEKWRDKPAHCVYLEISTENGITHYLSCDVTYYGEFTPPASSETSIYLTVNNEEDIYVSEGTLASGVAIKTDFTSFGHKDIKFGNNTPLSPLLPSTEEGYNTAILTINKLFPSGAENRKNSENFGDDITDPDDVDFSKWGGTEVGEVRAKSDFFDETSSFVAEHLIIPAYLTLSMVSEESPLAVQFYDGPMNIDMKNTEFLVGLPYTQSGDLAKLQDSLIKKGFDADDTLEVNGIFDEATQKALMEVADKIGDRLGSYKRDLAEGRIGGGTSKSFTSYIVNGNYNGDSNAYDPSGDDTAGGRIDSSSYDDDDVIPDDDPDQQNNGNNSTLTPVSVKVYGLNSISAAWNSYVTYGSVSNAQKAGKLAIAYAAVQNGLDGNLVASVSAHEGAFIPSRESNEFTGGAGSVNFTDTPREEGGDGRIIVYKGVQRAVRRAQGMMQVCVGEAFSYCAKQGITDTDQVVTVWRSAYGNAMIASNYLRNNIISLKKKHGDWIRSTANLPEWQKIQKATGIQASAILEYACSAVMYNKGPSTILKDNDYKGYRAMFENMRCTIDSNNHVTITSTMPGYSKGIIQDVANNTYGSR